jgi:polygalacturonase
MMKGWDHCHSTEANEGFKKITITHCVFESCEALAQETVNGGDIEDVQVSNTTMSDSVSAPILICLGCRSWRAEHVAGEMLLTPTALGL